MSHSCSNSLRKVNHDRNPHALYDTMPKSHMLYPKIWIKRSVLHWPEEALETQCEYIFVSVMVHLPQELNLRSPTSLPSPVTPPSPLMVTLEETSLLTWCFICLHIKIIATHVFNPDKSGTEGSIRDRDACVDNEARDSSFTGLITVAGWNALMSQSNHEVSGHSLLFMSS